MVMRPRSFHPGEGLADDQAPHVVNGREVPTVQEAPGDSLKPAVSLLSVMR